MSRIFIPIIKLIQISIDDAACIHSTHQDQAINLSDCPKNKNVSTQKTVNKKKKIMCNIFPLSIFI